MGYTFLEKGGAGFDSTWAEFAAVSQAPWQYAPLVVDYCREYSADACIKDATFFLMQNGEPLAMCPVFLERVGDHVSLSMAGGGAFPAPLALSALNRRQKQHVYRQCFEHIDRLAEEHGAAVARCNVCNLFEHDHNILQSYGYTDISQSTCVVDVLRPEDAVWTDVRKSYRSLIRQGEKHYTLTVLDSASMSYDDTLDYMKMHEKAAGRKTRPISTFIAQWEMVKNDNGIMVVVGDGERRVGFYYFIHFNNTAYYGSSAADPEYDAAHPIGQVAIWQAIRWYRNRGLRQVDLGLQYHGPQLGYVPSKKELDIAYFKRGFGGDIRSFYMGVKYYDEALLRSEMTAMLNTYISAACEDQDNGQHGI